jgi:N-acetylglucosamine-6-phosphate deacetylase
MLSLTPAHLCGVEDRKGSLEPGKDADIVLMTPDFEVSRVYVKGIQIRE